MLYNIDMKSNKKLSNYDFFLKVDTSPYKGEWVAIAESKIVAHGKNAQTVYKRAKKKAATEDISLAKVPSEQILGVFADVNSHSY